VVDLGLLLGSSSSSDRLSTRIILAKSAPGGQNRGEGPRDPEAPEVRVLGLIAEHVIDLVRVEPEQVTPAPVPLPKAPYLDSVARTDRGFVPLIDVPKLSLVVRQGP
jgi:chemotaxis signal transduction protein